jgi:hypothetical protein
MRLGRIQEVQNVVDMPAVNIVEELAEATEQNTAVIN